MCIVNHNLCFCCVKQLLAPEIRHERNVILQCVRYVVKHFSLHQSSVSSYTVNPQLLVEEDLLLGKDESVVDFDTVVSSTDEMEHAPVETSADVSTATKNEEQQLPTEEDLPLGKDESAVDFDTVASSTDEMEHAPVETSTDVSTATKNIGSTTDLKNTSHSTDGLGSCGDQVAVEDAPGTEGTDRDSGIGSPV